MLVEAGGSFDKFQILVCTLNGKVTPRVRGRLQHQNRPHPTPKSKLCSANPAFRCLGSEFSLAKSTKCCT